MFTSSLVRNYLFSYKFVVDGEVYIGILWAHNIIFQPPMHDIVYNYRSYSQTNTSALRFGTRCVNRKKIQACLFFWKELAGDFSLVRFLGCSSAFCIIVVHKDDMYLIHYWPEITTDSEITTCNNNNTVLIVILCYQTQGVLFRKDAWWLVGGLFTCSR